MGRQVASLYFSLVIVFFFPLNDIFGRFFAFWGSQCTEYTSLCLTVEAI